jgi:hypothetical protein
MKFKPPIILILLSSIFNFTLAQEVTLTFDCPDEVVAGSEGNILPINIDAFEDVWGIQFDIPFDPELIEFSEVTTSEVINDGEMVSWTVNEDTLFVISFDFDGTPTMFAGAGNIFNLQYNVIGDSGLDIHFEFANVSMSDGMGQLMDMDVSDQCTVPVVEPDPQIGDECEAPWDGSFGYYDCVLDCVPLDYWNDWLGDGYCDHLTPVNFSCTEFGYDCGDCDPNWDGTDPLGYCSEDCEAGFTYSHSFPENVQSDGNCFYTDNLVSLVDLITHSELEMESPFDIGLQTWEDGYLIHLYANDLELSTLPASINLLDSLLILDVSNNNITELPSTLWTMNHLYSLHVETNQLTSISAEIVNMQNLHGTYFRNNQIESIPVEFWDIPNLQSVFLSENNIEGELPIEIAHAVNIEWLWLEGNLLNGYIPDEICSLNPELFFGNCSGEPHFRIYGNELCPPYPDCTVEFIGYQNTEFCSECSDVVGDTNNDEIVNVLDIISVVNLLILIDDPPSDSTCYDNADVNEDGTVDVIDIVMMVNIILEE